MTNKTGYDALADTANAEAAIDRKDTIFHLEAASEVEGNSLAQAAAEGRTRVELSGHRFGARDKEELPVPWSSSKYPHSYVEDHEKKAGTLVKSTTAPQLELIRRVVIGEKPPRPTLQDCVVGVLCYIGSASNTRWWEGASWHVFIFAMQSHWEVWFVKALVHCMVLPVYDGLTPAERLEVGNLWYRFALEIVPDSYHQPPHVLQGLRLYSNFGPSVGWCPYWQLAAGWRCLLCTGRRTAKPSGGSP